MAVVGKTTGKWLNNDGLLVALNAKDLAVAERVGEFGYPTAGNNHVVQVVIDLTTLPTAAGGNEQIQDDSVTIPAGAWIDAVQVITEKETTGANANLDLGLVDQDRSTEIDFNGLLAAADAFNGGTDLGSTYTYQILDGTLTTEGGVLIGTRLTNTGLITASADTADWTAGKVRIKIFYHIPLAADYT